MEMENEHSWWHKQSQYSIQRQHFCGKRKKTSGCPVAFCVAIVWCRSFCFRAFCIEWLSSNWWKHIVYCSHCPLNVLELLIWSCIFHLALKKVGNSSNTCLLYKAYPFELKKSYLFFHLYQADNRYREKGSALLLIRKIKKWRWVEQHKWGKGIGWTILGGEQISKQYSTILLKWEIRNVKKDRIKGKEKAIWNPTFWKHYWWHDNNCC